MFKRASIVCFVLFCFALPASAQGIYTTAFAIEPDHGVFPGGFDLYDNFEPGAPVQGTGYQPYTIDASLKLVGNGATLGPVGARFRVVNDGDVLDQNHFAAFLSTLNGYQLTLDQSFLVGMDLTYLQVTTVAQERFGWARLKYTAAGLQILDQATALGGNGIIAGTTNVLPEPSTLSLIPAGAVGLLFAHRRQKSRRHTEPPGG